MIRQTRCADFSRNQNATLCVLHASQDLTPSAQSISVTSVLKLFRPQRTQRKVC